ANTSLTPSLIIELTISLSPLTQIIVLGVPRSEVTSWVEVCEKSTRPLLEACGIDQPLHIGESGSCEL
ncbi:hypothetical protein J6590_107305, partial [Homalodisca vitripennis]